MEQLNANKNSNKVKCNDQGLDSTGNFKSLISLHQRRGSNTIIYCPSTIHFIVFIYMLASFVLNEKPVVMLIKPETIPQK